MYRLLDTLDWLFSSLWNILLGVALYAITYFAETRGEVHIMFLAFMFDLFLGIIASIILHKQKFSMEKAFVAFMRLLISLIIIVLLYALDREMNQTTVSLYRIFAYLATGAWIISFADNGYQLTKFKPFLKVKALVNKGLTKTTSFSTTETLTETTTTETKSEG